MQRPSTMSTMSLTIVQTSVADSVHFFGSGSADLILKIRVRIRVTKKDHIRPDPDPT